MRIFLDANILFSAAKSDGAIRRLLSLLAAAGHELCADDYVLEEARRNLLLKGEPGSDLDHVLQMAAIKHVAHGRRSEAELPLPEKDRPVLEAAIRSRCHILVTGDKTHFGALYRRKIEGVEVLSAAQLAEKLL